MDKHLFLSVVVPIYNAESTLRQCIESIISQGIEDMELILVDDGSTDSSYKIGEEFYQKYPEIVQLHKKENGGEASARNYGMALAKGEYLSFVDSDDIIRNDYYNTVIENISHCAVIPDLIVTGCSRLESNKEYPIHCKAGFVDRKEFAHNFFVWKQQADLNVVWNKFFRRELLGGLTFEKRVCATDQIFCLNVYARISNVLFVDTCGYVQWMNPNSITHRLAKRYDPIFELENSMDYRKKVERLYKDVGVSENQLYKEYCRTDYVWFYTLVKNIFNEGTPYIDDKQKEQKIRDIMSVPERRECVLNGTGTSKLAKLTKVLYCLDSPKIVRVVFSLIQYV